MPLRKLLPLLKGVFKLYKSDVQAFIYTWVIARNDWKNMWGVSWRPLRFISLNSWVIGSETLARILSTFWGRKLAFECYYGGPMPDRAFYWRPWRYFQSTVGRLWPLWRYFDYTKRHSVGWIAFIVGFTCWHCLDAVRHTSFSSSATSVTTSVARGSSKNIDSSSACAISNEESAEFVLGVRQWALPSARTAHSASFVGSSGKATSKKIAT